jgi:Acyl-CoA dehydrogenase, C-terminal domain
MSMPTRTDMTSDEIELVRTSIRHLLASTPAAEVPAALLALGWDDVLAADPATAIGVLADEQGAARVAAPAVELAMLHGAGLVIEPGLAVVLPSLRPRTSTSASPTSSDWVVDGLVLAGHSRADRCIVLTPDGLASLPASSLAFTPIVGADPSLGLHRAHGAVSSTSLERVGDASQRTDAISAGRRALASELVGGAALMLADTVTYVMARQQYGRPIGSFQAVKHRLADVHVAVTAARAGVAAAWAHPDAVSSMAAKCLAGRAHQLASTHCHQVHGGIAFTIEHGFHNWIRRGQMLDALLGTASELTDEIGRTLIALGSVPRVPTL